MTGTTIDQSKAGIENGLIGVTSAPVRRMVTGAASNT